MINKQNEKADEKEPNRTSTNESYDYWEAKLNQWAKQKIWGANYQTGEIVLKKNTQDVAQDCKL